MANPIVQAIVLSAVALCGAPFGIGALAYVVASRRIQEPYLRGIAVMGFLGALWLCGAVMLGLDIISAMFSSSASEFSVPGVGWLLLWLLAGAFWSLGILIGKWIAG
jgi:cell division protein FtsX